MNKVKILHLADIINKNDFVDSLVSNLNRDEFETSVATFLPHSYIQDPEYADKGIVHYVLGISSRKQYITALKKILAIIKTNKIDILHTHMMDGAFLGSLIKLIYPKIRFVLGRHYSDEIYLTLNGWKRKRSLMIEKFSNKKADKIIAVSSFIKDLLKKQKISELKIFRANYGFDFSQSKYNPSTTEEVARLKSTLKLEGKFVVLNVGRHYFLKRQDLLMTAFESFVHEYEDARLLLAGDGPWNSYLKELATKKNILNKVIFLGWRKDISQLISLADIVVHPTMTEAFPQIMIEAMSIGTPLIISEVSGSNDHVKHLETGYVIKPGDVSQLKHSLQFMYDNPILRKQMANNARNYVINNLQIKDVIKDYEQLYKGLLLKKRIDAH